MAVCISLLFVPIIVYADNYTIKRDNQTFTIIIRPNNTITVQPQNNTQLELAIQKIVDKEQTTWTYGDIIISSSTIVGLLGIGSFLTFRIEGNELDRKIQVSLFYIIYISMFGIIMNHLATIYFIVTGGFNLQYYSQVIQISITGVGVILGSMSLIVFLQNRGKVRRAASINRINQAFVRAEEEH